MNGRRVAFMGFCCPRPFTFFSRESIYPVRLLTQMKRLLIPCLLALPAHVHGQETSPAQNTPVPAAQTQPLPRSKDGQEKGAGKKHLDFDPVDKIQQSLEARRKRIAGARKNARDRARARREAQQPEEPALVLPAHSSGKKDLPGRWVFQSDSLKTALVRQFQETVGKDATFKVGKITGNYTISINSDLTRIAAEWKEWKMDSTTIRGERSVSLSVSIDGIQEYEIIQIIDGKNPKMRKIEIKLLEDKTISESFFEGNKMRTKVELPTLSSGNWSLHEGTFHLQGSGQETAWKFTPHSAE